MVDAGLLPAGDLAAHQAEQPQLKLTPTGNGCEAPGVTAPFFCAHVREVVESDGVGAALGADRHERQQRLLRGGLRIKTTLDPRLQAAAQAAADSEIPRDDPSGVAAAVNIVEPGSGAIRAMAVNRVYAEDGPGSTKVNLATGGSSGMQAGSTFKPFVLAEALRMGIPLSTTITSPNTYSSPVFTDYRNGRKVPYTMSNAGDSQSGTFDLPTGTHGSVNTFYVQLQERTGVDAPAALAESMGLRQFSDGGPSAPLLRSGSFVLGANDVSPLALAGAYAAFAGRGLYCPPTAVTSIEDAAGQNVTLPQPGCRQVLDPVIADTVNGVLRGVIDGPYQGRTGRAATIGRPAAGKTGTTNGSRAAWFAGYTPGLATAVWVGRPVPIDMERIRIAGRYYDSVYGGTIPARIWQDTMRAAVTGTPRQDFPAPPQTRGAPDGQPAPATSADQ